MSIKKIFSKLFRITNACVAISIIPLVLLIPVFLPFKGLFSFFVIVIPLLILILVIVRMILSEKLNRKKAPVSFYAVIALCAIFWLILLGVSTNLYIKKTSLEQAGKILRGTYQLYNQKPFGLIADKSHKYQLLKTYLRSKLARFIPFPVNFHNIRILDYYVKNNNFYEADMLFDEIFVYQQYFFITHVKKPFIIDCGSHIGFSILYFKALFPEAEILGFEPDPGNFKLLKENIEKNNLQNVTLLKNAVSDIDEKIQFYGGSSATSSFLKERGGKEIIEIEAAKLSHYIDREVDFLKMDIEGAEKQVFEDLATEKKIKMIAQIVFEYHHHIKGNVDELSNILKLLEDNNFGYQFENMTVSRREPNKKERYEDILIYAYRK
jgi:FkbM family methyltransferase